MTLKKIGLLITLISLNVSTAFASDNIKLNIATQTYQCTISDQKLNCNPTNAVQSKVLEIGKNNGGITVSDTPKGLSLEINTQLNNNNVNYNLTLCSNTACSINNVFSDNLGSINQLTMGQYNITEKSFFVLGVSIVSLKSNSNLNLNDTIDFNSAIHSLENSFPKLPIK